MASVNFPVGSPDLQSTFQADFDLVDRKFD